ncbi:MAG: ferredoxin [Cyclobacteriaceae bacterium]
MEKDKESASQMSEKVVRPIQWTIDPPASELETKEFWKDLRQYYRTGEKRTNEKAGRMFPALLAQQDPSGFSRMNYPFFLSGASISSFQDLLQSAGEGKPEKEQKASSGENIDLLIKELFEALTDDQTDDFSGSIGKALEGLSGKTAEEGELDDLKKITEQLGKNLPKEGSLIGFDPGVPFLLLDHLLTEFQSANRRSFKHQLQQLSSGLNDLLVVEDQATIGDKLEQTYDFVHEIIAFDKLAGLMPKKASADITEARLVRLKSVLSTLTRGLGYFGDEVATVLLAADVRKKYQIDTLCKHAQIIESTPKNVFQQAQELFEEQMKAFTELIKAYRIALLEGEEKYIEDIHDEYFKHFTWHRLLEEELTLFHPLLLIVDHSYVMGNLTSFSKLIASNQPVKMLVVNDQLVSQPQQETSWEEASHHFRQELAAIAISHRNAYTFQSGIDDPVYLHKGLQGCLKSTAPAICHLLIPERKSRVDLQDYLFARAADQGRYFPKIQYDQIQGGAWGSRFDISGNVQPERNWPVYELRAKTSKEAEATIDTAFTYADYKAIYSTKVNELLPIPSAFYTEDLVPLSDYLELKEGQLYGKIPYIWLVDEKNELHRAAVPNVWVVSCLERRDFWNFIQELGGVNNYFVNQAIARKEDELQNAISKKEKELEASHQQALDEVREEAISQAAERLISVLLDDGELDLSLFGTDSNETPGKTSDESDMVTEVAEKAEQTDVSILKPWVDTDDCTTCNECVDKYGHLFKYNDDKQAYIPDPSTGTYMELVKAAEKCPAYCIHPGLPLNPAEKGLEALIKRAEKFN